MAMIQTPQAPAFKKPDVAPFIPKGMEDVVARTVAAGVKVIYSPQMREQVQQQLASQDPVPKKMAMAVVGLMLMLDRQAKAGIPAAALFPAALELLGEVAQMLVAAKQPVSQDDYNEAAQMMFVLMARKLGATDEQIMQGAQQAVAKQGEA